MANNQYRLAPKRRIEQIYSNINQAVTNSVGQSVLHTCEDRKTLVRVIARLKLNHFGGSAVSNRVGMCLVKEPQGTAVFSPTAAASLDNTKPDHLLWQTLTEQKDTSVEGEVIEFDTKGMRKLNVGDELVFRAVGSTADNAVITGSFTFIFKE